MLRHAPVAQAHRFPGPDPNQPAAQPHTPSAPADTYEKTPMLRSIRIYAPHPRFVPLERRCEFITTLAAIELIARLVTPASA